MASGDGAPKPVAPNAPAEAGAIAAGADEVVGGAVVADAADAVMDGAPLLMVLFELGPMTSVFSGVVDEGAGATTVEGIEPKPPPPVGGAAVVPPFRSCSGETGTLNVGW